MAAKKVRKGKTERAKALRDKKEGINADKARRATIQGDVIDAVGSAPLNTPDEDASAPPQTSDESPSTVDKHWAALTPLPGETHGAYLLRVLTQPLSRLSIVYRLLYVLVLAVAILTLFIYPFLDFGASARFATKSVQDVVEQSVGDRLKNLSYSMNMVNSEIASLRAQFEALTATSEDTKVSAVLSKLDSSLEQLDERVGTIESAILADPSKALEIPLLQNDIDHMKKARQSEMLSIREEISRIYDLNKWFVGLMFTMVLAMIGLAATNLFKGATAGRQKE